MHGNSGAHRDESHQLLIFLQYSRQQARLSGGLAPCPNASIPLPNRLNLMEWGECQWTPGGCDEAPLVA